MRGILITGQVANMKSLIGIIFIVYHLLESFTSGLGREKR